jgi:glycine dehydrogenase subunit 2
MAGVPSVFQAMVASVLPTLTGGRPLLSQSYRIARGEGETRKRVLVPSSAHGTNPATAVACGFIVDEIKGDRDGRVDLIDVQEKIGPDVAAIMLTNPNTCGLFERDVKKIADLVHEAGGYFYCDGANYNAIVGRVRPGDLGVDAMHINLHKTFSTPHGGGGPGSGPTVLSAALAPFAPLPNIVRDGQSLRLIENEVDAEGSPFGRMCAFHGQMGMYVRALTYMLSHGSDGLRQVAEDAVLNANYLLARLRGHFNAPFGDGPCMHEVLLDDSTVRPYGVETIDLAKALIDEGYHPMTTYFPLVVHGALLIEPTETESKDELDRFADVLIALAERAKTDAAHFKSAPHLAPMRRLDETRAARQPKLRWKPEEPMKIAAE